MPDNNRRNTIIFLVCAVALFVVYQTLVLDPAVQVGHVLRVER